jgi:hypothetical protein
VVNRKPRSFSNIPQGMPIDRIGANQNAYQWGVCANVKNLRKDGKVGLSLQITRSNE